MDAGEALRGGEERVIAMNLFPMNGEEGGQEMAGEDTSDLDRRISQHSRLIVELRSLFQNSG